MLKSVMTCRLAISLIGALPAQILAQVAPPPADSVLAAITARGRSLAAYDRAAWLATDAVLARWPNPSGVDGFLARQDERGAWLVLFARLSSSQDTLLVMATAAQQTSDSFSVVLHMPPRFGSDVERHAFRAMQTAAADLQSGPLPYRGTYSPYVLPRSGGGWLVYFLPARTQPSMNPHGGDWRYDVSPDGAIITKKVQMHRGVLMSSVPADAVAGMHTVVTADIAQDSDVFLVLTRRPLKPEVIGTDNFDYQIHANGTISWRYGQRTKQPE